MRISTIYIYLVPMDVRDIIKSSGTRVIDGCYLPVLGTKLKSFAKATSALGH